MFSNGIFNQLPNYEIEQFGLPNFSTIWVHNWLGKVGLVQWNDTPFTVDVSIDYYITAIFRIRPKEPCEVCQKLSKCHEDEYGYMICQSCEDNRNEAAAERYANDAESIINQDYSQYKTLK